MAKTNIQPVSHIGEMITCVETGKVFLGEAVGCTTNYASDAEGNLFSDEGVDIRQKRALLDRTKPAYGYLSSDVKYFTGWKGNTLGTVVAKWTINNSRQSWVHGSTMQAVRVRDVHGNLWYGRGNGGIAITLRAMKGE